MAEDLPRIEFGLDDQGRPVVLLGEQGEAADMAGLLGRAAALASPGRATDLAHAANHLAHGAEYRVIDDPAAFAAAYRARLDREDPNQEWREGVIRLRDFGVPDFAAIKPPQTAAGRLVFYAEDRFTGLPYRAEAADLTATPSYSPMPLTPLPRPSRPATGDETTPPTPEEEAAYRSLGRPETESSRELPPAPS